MNEKQQGNPPTEFEPKNKISRRDFLKLSGRALGVLGLKALGVDRIPFAEAAKSPEMQSLSRKEHFKPFNSGNAEWQYVEFQYKNDQREQIGITVSMSELTDPATGLKTQQLLVMRHNLNTKETQKNTYDGTRSFDESTSAYTFEDEGGNKLAELSYNEANDSYSMKIQTIEFNSDKIDDGGLVLNPQGNLIPVSKDGNFTVASFDGGRIDTNYFADHVRVERQNGDVVGYGRRDSENLELEGSAPLQLDIDHTWVHISGDLKDGKQVYITVWGSKTGGDYKFSDIMVVDPNTGGIEEMIQLNDEDGGFDLNFEPTLREQETPPDQTKKSKYQMAHGGKVLAKLNGNNLFELEIDGDPGQIIDGKGMLNMIEAHGRLISGSVLGTPIASGNSAIWETTNEWYSSFLPLITK